MFPIGFHKRPPLPLRSQVRIVRTDNDSRLQSVRMADGRQLEILAQGVKAWNAWRRENPRAPVDLSRADLSGADLRGANLARANLNRATLNLAKLDRANLAFAELKRAKLSFARLHHADLRAASLTRALADDAVFSRANLTCANLSHAELTNPTFAHATLADANLTCANLSGADLTGAQVMNVRHDTGIFFPLVRRIGFKPGRLRRHFKDLVLDTTMRVKGVNASSCYGSQRFKVFLQDQDFLEEYFDSPRHRRLMVTWWALSDCGRSTRRWALWSLFFALFFAFIYYCLGPQHFKSENLPLSFVTMVYYSGVTFTTLGYGDIAPTTHAASLVVLAEVILGYVMLGGLVSIFSGKLARRGG